MTISSHQSSVCRIPRNIQETENVYLGQPNARGEPRLEAGATEERTLEGVGSSAMFGQGSATKSE
jgi:hypothetical protein